MNYIIVFLCGTATMILELAGVRIVSPFLGSTHIVYTCIIGVIMGSLSLGYYLGGNISKKNPSFFKLAEIIFLSALYLFFLSFYEFNFLRAIFNLKFYFIYKALIISFLLFFIPSVLLGIVCPYITQLQLNSISDKYKINKEGVVVGKIYAVSTVGSIFGTFLCGFWLISFFGIDTIFFALSFELLFCSFLCFIIHISKKKIKIFYLLLIIIGVIFILLKFFLFLKLYLSFKPITVIPNSVYTKTTSYNYINIISLGIGKKKKLALRGTFNLIQSIKYEYLSPEIYASYYINMFHKIFVNKHSKNNILILGNAAGTFLSGVIHFCNENNINNISFDVVEIDKEFTKVGEKFFDMPTNDKRIKFFYEDARTFLNRQNEKKYDIIFYDIYTSDTYIVPYYLITKQAFKNIADKMNNDGILVMNVIGETKKESKKTMYLRQIYTQIKSVFKYTKIYKVNAFDYDYGNYLVAGWNKTNKEITETTNFLKTLEVKNIKENSEIFTDNYCPIEKFLEFY